MLVAEIPVDSDVPANPLVDIVYVAANMAHFATWFELPQAPPDHRWRLCFNTGDPISTVHNEEPFIERNGMLIGERSVAILRASATP
jgi:isoamylase